MSLLIPSSSVSSTPLYLSQWKTYSSNSPPRFSSNSFTPLQHTNCKTRHTSSYFKNQPNKYAARCKGNNDHGSYTPEEDTLSPWEGAVIYKRNASILHVEYCTTLERLGLGKLSTDTSKNRASVMGLRITKSVKDYPNGTPVQISIDVTRKKKKLRLDGIIKTVITLPCNRCCMPSAESIFSEFSLLLKEEPNDDEPETIDLGVIFGEDKVSTSRKSGNDDDDEDAMIDLDDQLYFPFEEKQIDISKNIRDRVHLEITMNSVCGSGCKGMCPKCGKNFNTGNCNCSKEEVKEGSFGPLGNLREQIETNSFNKTTQKKY